MYKPVSEIYELSPIFVIIRKVTDFDFVDKDVTSFFFDQGLSLVLPHGVTKPRGEGDSIFLEKP